MRAGVEDACDGASKAANAHAPEPMNRGLLPAVLLAFGLTMVITGDVAGDHRVLSVGVVIVGAAILTAVAGRLLRPDEAAPFDARDWASYLAQSTERGLLIVRPDQAELYARAVSAFGAAHVLYDRRQGERRQAASTVTIERRQSMRRQRTGVDFDIKSFGSAWIRR
jgi:hypothetical protein